MILKAFSKTLSDTIIFPLLPLVPLKIHFKKLLVLSKIRGAVISAILTGAMTTLKQRGGATCRRESARRHAGQSLLTLEVNGWKALGETAVGFKAKTTHWPGVIGAGMQKGQDHT